jgi:hypothetical protein
VRNFLTPRDKKTLYSRSAGSAALGEVARDAG